jgi:hypothetical protein
MAADTVPTSEDCNCRREKNLEPRSTVSRVLEEVAEERFAGHMWVVREGISSAQMADKTAQAAEIRQGIRQFLQPAMRWEGESWQKQSFLRQRKPRQSLSSGILDCTAKNLRARWQLLLSLFGKTKEIGRSSHRPGYDQQRSVESRCPLSEMPLFTARSSDEGSQSASRGKVGTAVVTSVVREVWLPDAVYNIEVLDNKNYFADEAERGKETGSGSQRAAPSCYATSFISSAARLARSVPGRSGRAPWFQVARRRYWSNGRRFKVSDRFGRQVNFIVA